MSVNPYTAPQSDVDNIVSQDAPALWSPGVAAGIAFFLSPVFGALINMKNWQALGESEKAAASKLWAIGTVAFYVILIALIFLFPNVGALDLLSRVAGLGFFIAWYMVSGKDQKDVVEYRYGKTYPKRGWGKPVLYAIGIYVAIVIAVVIAGVAFAVVTGAT